MELKPGYKRTDAGMIPKDWGEFSVGDLIDFQGGSQPQKSVFSAVLRPDFVRLIQIRDYKSNKFEVFAPTALLRRFCNENDIMIGRYGPPVFQILRGLSGAYNVALIKAIPRPDIDSDFAYFFLKQDSLFEFIDKLSRRSSGQTGVDLSELRLYPLPLPPLPEQRAIADALSDVDALLAKLDQIITKKRDLKQAAMQQLLTGQTRLPGFGGEWEVRQLDSVADIRSGGTPSTVQPEFWDGDVMWCTPTDITALSGRKYLNQTTRSITSMGLKCSSAELIPVGSVVMTSRATIGECAINAVPVATNQGFKNFVPFPEVAGEFLFYLLQMQKQEFIGLCSGSTFLEIGKTQLVSFEVKMPSGKKEQTAIATVLSDMDTEISVLEARREKTQAIKRGMMQELLTGRIRLV